MSGIKKSLIYLLTTALLFGMLCSFAFADNELSGEGYEKVTVEYTLPSTEAEIGESFTVSYEIKGGSGQFDEIWYGILEVTESSGITEYDRGERLTETQGTFTVVPECGEFFYVYVSCHDQKTGLYWTENGSENITCTPNTDIPASIHDISPSLSLNEPFTFSYSIGGENEISEARAEVWVFARNGIYPDCVLQQTLENKSGEITYTPKAGNQLYIAIRGKDTEGNPFYIKTDRLDVNTETGYDEVSVVYTLPSTEAEIGKPFTVSYEIKGGSGQFDEISYSISEITESCDITEYDRGDSLSDAQGTFTVVPECGEFFQVRVGCRDQETGLYWTENYSEDIICLPNTEINASIHDISSSLSLNEPFTFSYSIGGENEISEARAEVWVFARNDIYPDCVLEKTLEDKSGEITYTPKAGDQLYIAIRGKDTEGNPFYIKTDRLDINAGTDYEEISVIFTLSEETAEIGKPYTIGYEIKGGSGQFDRIWYRVHEITENTAISKISRGDDLTAVKGTFTVIPECGECFNVNIGCHDQETGLTRMDMYCEDIVCIPNTEIPVNIFDIFPSLSLNEPFTFSYSIGSENEIGEADAEIWVFTDDAVFPNCVLEQTIENKIGEITYIPKVGNQLYIAIRGKDTEGNPFYVKTDRLDINAGTGYEEVSVEFTLPTETAEIGKPYTIGYEIKGGSGQFDRIWYRVHEYTENCGISKTHRGEDLTTLKGTFTVIPECGECFNVNIGCHDQETGLTGANYYCEDIICTPNTDVPASIYGISSFLCFNEPFTFSYTIGGENELGEACAEIWVFTNDVIYPDCVLEQTLDNKTGRITYTPKAGNQLYIALRGKDTEGNPFYVKTNRINILALTDCLILPSSLRSIEANAFYNVQATKVYIPESVVHIDETAFLHSRITTIYGHNDYVETYARENGFEYYDYSGN